VEKEVVGAVKAALRRAELTSAGEAATSASRGGFGEKAGKGEWERMGEGKLKEEVRDEGVQHVSPPSSVSTPPDGGSAKSPCAFPGTPSPRKKPPSSAKSPTVKSPGSLFGGEGSPRIKSPAGSPGGLRLGGLLMACISPQRGARAQGSEEEEGDVGGGQERCAKPEIVEQTPEERPKLCQGGQDEYAKSDAGTPGKQQQSEQGQLGKTVDIGGQGSGLSTPVSSVKSGGRPNKVSCAKSEVGTPGKKQESEQGQLEEIVDIGGQRSGVSTPVSGVKSGERLKQAADRYSYVAESPEEKLETGQGEVGGNVEDGAQRSGASTPVSGGKSGKRLKQAADRYSCAAESLEAKLETGQGEIGGNVSADGGESGVFSPGSGAKSAGRPSKAAERYSRATDSSESDDEQGHVTSAFRGFSPGKSPVKTPSKSPAYASPSKCGVPGVREPEVGELSPQPAATPGGKITEDLAVEKSDGAEEKLVGEMVNRLVGLSEEQRNAVSSVVATRGFGGFLENSPFASRQGFAFPGFISSLACPWPFGRILVSDKVPWTRTVAFLNRGFRVIDGFLFSH
jgi:hypothetical protein